MIGTFRVARQTSRWSRFAAVTVEADPDPVTVVRVADSAGGSEAVRREALAGARWALDRVPAGSGGHRVTVTDIVRTDVDTGVGDVYEAAARAVWQALGIDPQLDVGFSDPDLVAGWLRGRVGRRLAGVTEARHWYRGQRDPDSAKDLVHAWLHFDHHPPTRLHAHGDDLLLSTSDPYPSYDMGAAGAVRVGPASPPDVLAHVAGRRLTDAAVILGPFDRPACAGLLLRLEDVDAVIGTFCDEWIVAFDQPPAHLRPFWRTQQWIMNYRAR